jgi:hypothetical protein
MLARDPDIGTSLSLLNFDPLINSMPLLKSTSDILSRHASDILNPQQYSRRKSKGKQ